MRRLVVAALLAASLGPVASARAAVGVDTKGLAPAVRGLADDGSVAAAGDVDGDGLADLLAGPLSEQAQDRRCDPALSYVLQDVAQVRLRTRTVRLGCPSVPLREDVTPDGTSYGWSGGGSVAVVGDVNGDGIGDLAVGSGSAGPRGRPSAGSVYLVFGAPDLGDRNLQALGAGGVRIDGPGRRSELGRSIVPVGDVNGDGLADVALTYDIGVAALDGRRLGHSRPRVAIVFGGLAGGSQVDLQSPGGAALVVAGILPQRNGVDPLVRVAPAGDLDRDGRDDVALAVRGAGLRDRVMVLAGRPGGGIADLRRERALLRVRGAPDDMLGASIASAGDLDGDGRPELAIGSALEPNAFTIPDVRDAVIVVPGRPGAIDLAAPPADVRRIVGPLDRDAAFGSALAAAGDLTGDGIGDLVAGAPDASPGCRIGAGAAWVLPGRPGGGTERLETVAGAWRVDGAAVGARLGRDVAAGDANGDGRPELLLPTGDGPERDLLVVGAGARRTQRPDAGRARCLRVVVEARSASALRLRVSSSMGAATSHRVRVTVRAAATTATVELGPAVTRTLRLHGPATRRLTVPLPPARDPRWADVKVEQVLGDGPYGTSLERYVRLPR